VAISMVMVTFSMVPPLKMYTVLVQKGNKDIIKVVHVTSEG